METQYLVQPLLEPAQALDRRIFPDVPEIQVIHAVAADLAARVQQRPPVLPVLFPDVDADGEISHRDAVLFTQFHAFPDPFRFIHVVHRDRDLFAVPGTVVHRKDAQKILRGLFRRGG